jgi:hypothetical protein
MARLKRKTNGREEGADFLQGWIERWVCELSPVGALARRAVLSPKQQAMVAKRLATSHK